MLRNTKRFILALALAVVVAAGGIYMAVRASLPILDGSVAVTGLQGTVSIDRDDHGIPTVTAGDRESLAFGTGFVHAQDRFFQMDLLRRQSAGELAELVGAAALPLDRRNRLHRFRHRAELVLGGMSEEHVRVLAAYTRGVNAGLEELGARPPEYLLLGGRPSPWREADTILVLYSMYLVLNDSRASRDIARGHARAALPAGLFAWIYPPGSEWDAPVEGPQFDAPPMPTAAMVDLRGADMALLAGARPPDRTEMMPGSNNWAVAGKLTTNGAAIVANDMHLGIDSPNIWYRARLMQDSADGIDVSGVTLPGTPFVVTGSNGHVAWGFTNSYGDWTDAVVLVPGEADDTYRTPEGDRRFDRHVETIRYGGGSEELIVRETIWGPVSDAGYPDGEIAVSWIAHRSHAANLGHLDLEKVRTLPEALEVANRIGIPPQNFVAGDADGNIGWTIAGQIPRRAGAPADSPGDWSTGAGWQGWYAAHEYPRIVNPDGGRIWTANARVVGGDALAIIGDSGYDLGARAGQIRDGLNARDEFSPADMLDVHLDDRALFLERWRGLLLDLLDQEALAGAPGRAEFRRLVDGWTARAAVDAVGYRLVRDFRREVRNTVFDMLTLPIVERFGPDAPRRMSRQFEAALWTAVTERPAHLLAGNFASWRELLLGVVDANLAHYESSYGDGLAARTWGEVNTGQFGHPLTAAIPALSGSFDLPSQPLPGDNNMPRVQGPTYGASERFAVSPGHEPEGYLHMPGGQSGHPLSPYRLVGHDAWVAGLASPFLPGPSAHSLRLLPAAP